MRSGRCLAATRLGRRLNLGDGQLASVYYTSLLRYVGCTAFSHEKIGATTRAGAALYAMENGLYLVGSAEESTV